MAMAFLIGMIGSAWGHNETVSIHKNTKVSTVIDLNQVNIDVHVVSYENYTISCHHTSFEKQEVDTNFLVLKTDNKNYSKYYKKPDIYDITGKRILYSVVNNHFIFKELHKGIYFISNSSSTEIEMRKIILYKDNHSNLYSIKKIV